MAIRTLSEHSVQMTIHFFVSFDGCNSVNTSLINTKLGDVVNLGVLFLTMWINSCLSNNLKTRLILFGLKSGRWRSPISSKTGTMWCSRACMMPTTWLHLASVNWGACAFLLVHLLWSYGWLFNAIYIEWKTHWRLKWYHRYHREQS